LIVCTANICRSPAAAALWRIEATKRGVAHPADSAGLKADPGRPADPMWASLLGNRGIDLAAHRAQPFLPQAAMRYDLILCMEPTHVRYVESLAPVLAGRVQLFGRWGQGPIPDPYGGDISGYDRCLALIESAVQSWMDRLVGRRAKTAASTARYGANPTQPSGMAKPTPTDPTAR
jgi:protein-tyrosine phosphatase